MRWKFGVLKKMMLFGTWVVPLGLKVKPQWSVDGPLWLQRKEGRREDIECDTANL